VKVGVMEFGLYPTQTTLAADRKPNWSCSKLVKNASINHLLTTNQQKSGW